MIEFFLTREMGETGCFGLIDTFKVVEINNEIMKRQLIFDPRSEKPMKVACFMSGSGTNAIKIIERSLKSDSKYEVSLVFAEVRDDRMDKTGNKICRALDIAREYGVAYEHIDIRDFYQSKGHSSKRDLSLRPEFDLMILDKINPYNIDVIALAGYMSIVTIPLLDYYDGRVVNVHPADLSVMEDGRRKYVGMHAVRDAILAGETVLHSTTHIVREKVDYGEILVRSKPLAVDLPSGVTLEGLIDDKRLMRKVANEHQNRLKRHGDWVIFPLTLQLIADGRFEFDGRGNIYFDGAISPSGLML
jgi:folate-dependent phosphoribosylglycinamide formyltransferase PurN